MKKIIVAALLVVGFAFSINAQFKVGAGVSLLEGDFGVQAKAHNTFSEAIAGQASFSYYFPGTGVTFWSLDADVHYTGFNIGDVEGFRIAPFAGLNYGNVSVDGVGGDNDLGINLGVNGTLPLDGGLEVFIEPKIVLGGNINGFGLAAGVYF